MGKDQQQPKPVRQQVQKPSISANQPHELSDMDRTLQKMLQTKKGR